MWSRDRCQPSLPVQRLLPCGAGTAASPPSLSKGCCHVEQGPLPALPPCSKAAAMWSRDRCQPSLPVQRLLPCGAGTAASPPSLSPCPKAAAMWSRDRCQPSLPVQRLLPCGAGTAASPPSLLKGCCHVEQGPLPALPPCSKAASLIVLPHRLAAPPLPDRRLLSWRPAWR